MTSGYATAGHFLCATSFVSLASVLDTPVMSRWLLHFRERVDLQRVDPRNYSHALFVCGPFMQREWEASFLGRFVNCFVIGVNLTLPFRLMSGNPFDFLVERDSSRTAHPDFAFVRRLPEIPVTRRCLVELDEGGLVSSQARQSNA